jgi:uncharacterized protein YjaG (DUF416 family)
MNSIGYIKELEKQLESIEKRLNNVDDFKEWAILQNAKATILTTLLHSFVKGN